MRNVETRRKPHVEAVQSGHDTSRYVATNLVSMYSKCGRMSDARQAFEKIRHPDAAAWTALISGYVENGEEYLALELFAKMANSMCDSQRPDSRAFVPVLKACTRLAAGKMPRMGILETGMAVHALAAEHGCISDLFVANTLVSFYARCGSMTDARLIFEELCTRHVVSWNVIIQGYVENGQAEEALELFQCMDCKPNGWTLVSAFKACSLLAGNGDGPVKFCALEKGMAIHAQFSRLPDFQSVFVQNSLIDMYGKSGSLYDSRRVFDRMRRHDLVSWNTLNSVTVQNGQFDSALDLFVQLISSSGMFPDARTYVAALKACASVALGEAPGGERVSKVVSLEKGMAVHAHFVKSSCQPDSHLTCSLIDMYSKCGDMESARSVFRTSKSFHVNVACWNSMIRGHNENGQYDVALQLFDECMASRAGCDSLTLVAALKACTGLASKDEGRCQPDDKAFKLSCLEKGMALHGLAVESSYSCTDLEPRVATTLIDMYATCGSMVDARRCFDGLTRPNVVSWTALILGYATCGQARLALELFAVMQAEDVQWNGFSFVAAFKACSSLASEEEEAEKLELVEKVMAVHSQARMTGCMSDIYVGSSAVGAYVKCGAMELARWVFESIPRHSLVAWNSLLLGYVNNGESELALELFQASETPADSWTFVTALKACKFLAAKEAPTEVDGEKLKLKSLETLMSVHSQASRRGHEQDSHVACSTLEAYSSCGSMPDARRVFERTPANGRNVVVWTALITGYVENDQAGMALKMLVRMRDQGRCMPNQLTFAAALGACKTSGTGSELGKTLQGEIYKLGLESMSQVIIAQLLDFHAKRGNMSGAQLVFDSFAGIGIAGWSCLLTGYSMQGSSNSSLVLSIFKEMQELEMRADSVVFLAVLSACSHSGLVDTAKELFRLMSSPEYGVTPSIEHYHCLADLLYRAGQAREAVDIVKGMPFEGDSLTQTLNLAAYRKWRLRIA